ncbi:MAG: hypothetical protein KAS04_02175 [Candidatus Aenigmarchaeota archaeon]|nr:hypothetical protein [Candidatus Aenigmarchaeota archaeon]
MDFVADILRTILGRIHFMIYLGKSPAAEIEIIDKNIVVHILNPLIALELGVEELFSKKGKKDINMLENIRKAGYKIKIKYKMFEIDL